MHEVRELDRIADEEDRPVDADHVPVALLGVELDGEATRVARLLRRSAIAHHGREAYKDRSLGARREHLRAGQRTDVGGGNELTEEARAARVDDALRDALPIE